MAFGTSHNVSPVYTGLMTVVPLAEPHSSPFPSPASWKSQLYEVVFQATQKQSVGKYPTSTPSQTTLT